MFLKVKMHFFFKEVIVFCYHDSQTFSNLPMGNLVHLLPKDIWGKSISSSSQKHLHFEKYLSARRMV